MKSCAVLGKLYTRDDFLSGALKPLKIERGHGRKAAIKRKPGMHVGAHPSGVITRQLPGRGVQVAPTVAEGRKEQGHLRHRELNGVWVCEESRGKLRKFRVPGNWLTKG